LKFSSATGVPIQMPCVGIWSFLFNKCDIPGPVRGVCDNILADVTS
jgi:hypothetical protein